MALLRIWWLIAVPEKREESAAYTLEKQEDHTNSPTDLTFLQVLNLRLSRAEPDSEKISRVLCNRKSAVHPLQRFLQHRPWAPKIQAHKSFTAKCLPIRKPDTRFFEKGDRIF